MSTCSIADHINYNISVELLMVRGSDLFFLIEKRLIKNQYNEIEWDILYKYSI